MNRWRTLFLGLATALTANCRVQTDGLGEVTSLPASTSGHADSGIAAAPNGGTTGFGDAAASGARASAGGTSGTSGVSQAGGAPGSGGTSVFGGTGSISGTGGAIAMGGSGDKAESGAPGAGGADPVGGTTIVKGTGGLADTGGADNKGGTGGGPGSGGAGGSGGNPTLVGAGGGAGTGGASGTQAPDAAVDLPPPPPPDGSPDTPTASGDETSRDATAAPPDLAPPPPDLPAPPLDANSSLRLIWSDEFDGDANTGIDPNKWSYVAWNPGHVNSEIQKYTDRLDNVYLDGNGNLVIQALNIPYQGFVFTSGRITTQNTRAFGPGVRVEVRAKLPAGIGSFPGIVMLGTTDAWPSSGELAIAEQYGQDKSWMYVSAYADTNANGSTGNIRTNYVNATTASTDFHVYAVDWYADHLDFQVDGTMVVTKPFSRTSPFANIQEYINLDLALGGTMGGNVDPTAFPTNMKMTVDYVRVYSLP